MDPLAIACRRMLLPLVGALITSLIACGHLPGQPSPATNPREVTVDISDNGQFLEVHVGNAVRFTLDHTTWTFSQSSAPSVLVPVGQQEFSPGRHCYPGLGCGTTTARFKALAPSSAIVSATRVSCGEARSCPGDEGIYRVTVLVAP